MSGIQHATSQSIKPFKSSEEYLYAMKEDLAEWLKDLYNVDIDVNNILEALETGALLCAHANNVTRVAGEFLQKKRHTHMQLPTSGVTFVSTAQPATFLARDNISNFISWCRKQMGIKDVLMFETDDLVLRKNEKNFVLCLLEVARRASRFGMAAPVLIQLEEEIEEEIMEEFSQETTEPKPQRRLSNTQNLDEMVQCLISRCTCPTQFPMVKVSEGKYRVGSSCTLIFVRILRNHVMVRVGGGWDTLEHYLDKHDPCRCTSLTHKLAQHPRAPVHEIKARLTPQPDSQAGNQTAFLLSRAQSPLPAVVWTPSGPSRAPRPGIPPRPSRSPDRVFWVAQERSNSTPNRHGGRSPTPTRRLNCSGSKDDSVLNASTRTGREVTRTSPSPRLTSSLPRPNQSYSAPQTESQRPKTPLCFQETPSHKSLQHQQSPVNKLGQTWTKSQFVSKLRQNATAGSKGAETPNRATKISERHEGPVSAKLFQGLTPAHSSNPARNTPSITIQHTEDNDTPQESPVYIRTFSPSKGVRGGTSSDPDGRPLTPIGQRSRSADCLTEKRPKPESNKTDFPTCSISGERTQRLVSPVPKHTVRNAPLRDMTFRRNTSSKSNANHVPGPRQSRTEFRDEEEELERSYLFTPPPISPAQEASLYQTLEHEILSNLQQLNTDVDKESDPEDDKDSCRSETPRSPRGVSSQCPRHLFPPDSSNVSEKNTYYRSSSADRAGKASFDSVIAELSAGTKQLNRVSVENWVNSLPRTCREKKLQRHTEAESSQHGVSKPCATSSCSSFCSSVESKKPVVSDESDTVHGNKSTEETEVRKKPRSSSFKQKRLLKKPERVPSIYKLKLRPRARPRRDHRPDKKPSKIPRPVSYRITKNEEDSLQNQKPRRLEV
ncbi:GAS2-like protein 2 [Chanos chanos]|uniref:GAS2-like protein 2 n=1 Tax=Chanos chanos TaxID=29144 RepID=A0A6J2WX13_CHACN|nr:GAS2-like protein 2 [Chanos chanos]